MMGIIRASVRVKWKCVLDLDLMSIVSGLVHDIPLAVCKLRHRDVIEDCFVQLGVGRVDIDLVEIKVQV